MNSLHSNQTTYYCLCNASLVLINDQAIVLLRIGTAVVSTRSMLIATCNKVVTCELTNTREKRAGHGYGTSDFVSAHYRPALWPRSTLALHVVPPVSEIYTTHHPAGQGRGGWVGISVIPYHFHPWVGASCVATCD
jgi:hypothetical protein